MNLYGFVGNNSTNAIDVVGAQMYDGYSAGCSLAQRSDFANNDGTPDFAFENSQRIFDDAYQQNDFFDNTEWYEGRFPGVLSEALRRATADVQFQMEKYICKGVGGDSPNEYPVLAVVNQARVIDSDYPTGNTVMDSSFGDDPESWIEATYTGIGSHSFIIEQTPISSLKVASLESVCCSCDYYYWESSVLLRDRLGPDYNEISISRGRWEIAGMISCCKKKERSLY